MAWVQAARRRLAAAARLVICRSMVASATAVIMDRRREPDQRMKVGIEADGPTLTGGRDVGRGRCGCGSSSCCGGLNPKNPRGCCAAVLWDGFFGFGGAAGAISAVPPSGPAARGATEAEVAQW